MQILDLKMKLIQGSILLFCVGAALSFPQRPGVLPPNGDDCICITVISEVCGSDQSTYQNECRLNCAKNKNASLRKVKDGACTGASDDEICVCPSEWMPVCGNNKNTYSNQCELDCDSKKNPNIKKERNGPCPPAPPTSAPQPDCICPSIIDPICSSLGKTYNNDCELDCDRKTNPNIKKERNGPCPPAPPTQAPQDDCICSSMYDPVCGSNGKTYSNNCNLECERKQNPNIKKESNGICKPPPPGPGSPPPAKREIEQSCICILSHQPICVEDETHSKVTYDSCKFDCMKKTNPNLKKSYDGECKEEEKRESESADDDICICIKNFDPICAKKKNGTLIKFNNKCLYQCALKKEKDLVFKHEGECEDSEKDDNQRDVTEKPVEEEEICICNSSYQPVCSNTKQDFSNLCRLNCAAKRDPSIKKASDGVCVKEYKEECICTKELNYVCGSDKKQYSNKRCFECAQKETPGLILLNEGECPEETTSSAVPSA